MCWVSRGGFWYSDGHEVSQDLGATVPGNAEKQAAFWGRERAGLPRRREARELRCGGRATPGIRPRVATFSGRDLECLQSLRTRWLPHHAAAFEKKQAAATSLRQQFLAFPPIGLSQVWQLFGGDMETEGVGLFWAIENT